MRARSFFLALALLACAPSSAQSALPPFVDTFRTLDDDRWVFSDGWTNGDWTANDWQREQVSLRPHGIDITLARARGVRGKRFSSGELQSEIGYRYGYFETRMRVPRGSGLVTGFFTYTRDEHVNTWDEIDIEILGRNTRAIQFTYFRRGRRHIVTRPLEFDAAAGFHNYAFEWTPHYLRWYVDGALMHEERGANGPLPQSEQRLFLHLWNTETLTSWLGPINPREGPWRLSVACVAYAPQYDGRQLCNPQTDE